MSALIGTLGIFDYKNQDWDVFYGRLKLFIQLNDIEAAKQSALLLTNLSDDSYRLVSNLLHPKKIVDATFKELVEILNEHFTPKRSTFADRSKFYDAVKYDNESAEEWAARLRGLAVFCNFGSELNVLLRDRFVLGFRFGPERDRLCEQDLSTLTFAKALEIAQQTACARKARASDAGQAVIVKEEPLYKASARRAAGPRSGPRPGGGGSGAGATQKRCGVCGLSNHEENSCRFRNYRCTKCKNKSHLRKMCRLAVNNLKSCDVQVNCDDPQGSDSSHECEECQLLNLRCVNTDPILLTIRLNNDSFKMELDSGSSSSVISEMFYNKYLSQYPLSTNCNIKMCFYNGHKITPIGHLILPVSYNNTTKDITFYVIQNGGSPLLGRDFMISFGIQFVINNNLRTSTNDHEILKLLNTYQELFNGELGCYKGFEVNLQLKEGAAPIFCKARPVPFAIKKKVESELDRLVKMGILVQTNHSDYAAPIVPVLKPNGTIRICADYSISLNNDIIVDKYPLPRIDEVFVKLSGGQQFSKLDCSQAYNQLLLSTNSQKLTTINTSKGLFMYTRLVFGLASAPAIFQKAIESLLAGIEGVTIFLDDVCVTGPTRQVHLNRLEEVFRRFKTAGLKLEKSKCAFFQDKITYLGHVIDKNGLHKCSSKIEAILNAPQPNSVPELKRFLGMINYYRNFIPNASSILSPLHELLRAEEEWEWTDRHRAAFELAKTELTSERVLAHYDPDATLVLAVDASPAGLGAVLSQVDKDGMERPLAFGSRSLTSSERNYSQLHKEATSIIFGVKRFHQYLYGRKDPFILKTDHRPLTTIFGKNKGLPPITAARLIRYSIILSGYNYKIMYTKGRENQVADYFSRAPVELGKNENNCQHLLTINALQLTSLPITYKQISEATKCDSVLQKVIAYTNNGWPKKIKCQQILPYFKCKNDLEVHDGCLLRGHRVVIPKLHRDKLLGDLHKSHQGIVKTKSIARSRMWWPSIDRHIEQMIGACAACSALRPAPRRAPLAPWPRPTTPFERVHIDFMSINQRSYLVVVDAFSKWIECFDMCGNLSTCNLLLNLKNVFTRFGLPKLIVSDNDPKICSNEFIQFCKISGIQHLTSPIYHPNSNGQAENSVRICKNMIKTILQQNTCTTKINELLMDYLFEYRSTVNCSTGETPAKLLFGRELRNVLDLIKPPITDAILTPHLFGTGAHLRSFTIGQQVWGKYYVNRKPYWRKAIIKDKIGNRLYMVQFIGENELHKRHVDQLKRYQADRKEDTINVTYPTAGSTSQVPPVFPIPQIEQNSNEVIDQESADESWQEALEEGLVEEEESGLDSVETVERSEPSLAPGGLDPTSPHPAPTSERIQN